MKRHGSRRKGARSFPLRRIVSTRLEPLMLADGVTPSEYLRPVEVLECGHTMPPRSDIFGETNAGSRRCAECAKSTHNTNPKPEGEN